MTKYNSIALVATLVVGIALYFSTGIILILFVPPLFYYLTKKNNK